MGLKIAGIWRRLRTLLEYHQTLVAENRNKKRMVRVASQIRRLQYLLEQYEKENKDKNYVVSE